LFLFFNASCIQPVLFLRGKLFSKSLHQLKIEKVKFKSGLLLEIEVIPIADTLIKHQQSITLRHRHSSIAFFGYSKGGSELHDRFQQVTIKPNSFLFVSKDRVQALDNQKSKPFMI
jgi:hypothetical protein